MKRIFTYYKSSRVILLVVSAQIFCVDIGSDTAVTRFNTKQALNTGDRVAGFAALAAGFRIANRDAVCTWDCFFPATGDIGLSHGTLILNRDLVCYDITSIKELGNINAQFHNIDLSPSVTGFPALQTGSDAFNIDLVASASQADDVLTCDWSYDGQLLAIGLAALAAAHDLIRIYRWNGTTLTLLYTLPRDQYVSITSVRWHPSLYVLAVARLTSAGTEMLSYSVNPTTGVMTLLNGIEFGGSAYSLDWHPTGSWVAVGKAAGTSTNELQVHPATSAGSIITAPAAVVNIAGARTPQNDALHWDQSGTYIAIGLDAVNPQFIVYTFSKTNPGTLTQYSVPAASLGVAATAVRWNKVNTNYLAVGLSGTTGNLLSIYQNTITNPTLVAANTTLGQTVRSISWRGLVVADAIAIGRYTGTGNELQAFGWTPASPYLTDQVAGYEYAANLNVVRWSPNGLYLAAGGDANTFNIYAYRTAAQDCVTMTNVNLIFNQNILWDQECTHFSGVCKIIGNGHSLDLSATCSIIVDAGSSLLFDNVEIDNINTDKIQMVDALGTISLRSAAFVLDGNYTVTQGKFVVLNSFTIQGEGYTFAYATDQASLITGEGSWVFDNGVTFSYVPPIASRDLIQFENSAAEFVLRGATLYTTNTGIRLQTGHILIDRSSALYNTGSVESEAISFASSARIEFMPNATVDILNGLVVYE
jgi:hypothetical protein